MSDEEIIKIAEEFKRGLEEQRGAFTRIMAIMEKSLALAKEEEKDLKDLPVEDIVRDKEKYLLRRVELETKRTVLENLINKPKEYIQALKMIEEKK